MSGTNQIRWGEDPYWMKIFHTHIARDPYSSLGRPRLERRKFRGALQAFNIGGLL